MITIVLTITNKTHWFTRCPHLCSYLIFIVYLNIRIQFLSEMARSMNRKVRNFSFKKTTLTKCCRIVVNESNQQNMYEKLDMYICNCYVLQNFKFIRIFHL